MTSIIDTALELAKKGIPCFPLRSNKKPCHEGGFKTASTDRLTLHWAFADPMAALVGVPTGAVSGIDVVDIDPRDGGDIWFRDHEHELPATRRHASPRYAIGRLSSAAQAHARYALLRQPSLASGRLEFLTGG